MFSKTAEYALRATFFIAQKGSKEVKLSIGEIAKGIGSPQPFTSKILQTLTKNSRIISSVRGPKGGFYLSEKAKKLPISAILEAMDEKKVLLRCVLGLPECSSEKPCPLHKQFLTIKTQLNEMFDTTSIDMVAKDLDKQKLFLSDQKRRTVSKK